MPIRLFAYICCVKSRMSIHLAMLFLVAFFAAETAVFAFSKTSSITIVKQDSDLIKNQDNGMLVWEEISEVEYAIDSAENDTQTIPHVGKHTNTLEFSGNQLSLQAISSDPCDLRGRIFQQLFPFHFFW